MSRIALRSGRYLQPANPAAGTMLDETDPLDANYEVDLAFQVYGDTDEPLQSGDYYGAGQVVDREAGRKAVILGDPYRHATLTEYRMDAEPTAESLAIYERTRQGVLDAIDKRRKRKDADYDYLRGYEGAKRALKLARGRSR
jgi:hypothetical protein